MMQQDRRTALMSFAGAAAGASVLLTGCAKRDREEDEDSGGGVTANEDLMREHGVLRRILVVYREVAPKLAQNVAGIDASALAQAATLFHAFGEEYHERLLEEQHIFPAVRKAGGDAAALVDILLAQHQSGRAITDFLLDRTRSGRIATGDGEALAKAMTSFCRMYEAHTAREDTVIFPAFKRSIGQKRYRELGEQFEEIEHKQFGGDGFGIALDKVKGVEQALGLSGLAAFTAPLPGS